MRTTRDDSERRTRWGSRVRPSVDPARYDQRVTVQSPVFARSSTGAVSQTWTTVGTFWSSVRYLRGEEGERVRSVHARAEWMVSLRACSELAAIEPNWRIVWDGKAYDPQAIAPWPAGRPQRWDVTVDAGEDTEWTPETVEEFSTEFSNEFNAEAA